MGRDQAIGASAALFLLAMLASISVEADYRFEEGVYLGSANLLPDWAATLKRARRQQPGLDACLAAPDTCPRHLRGVSALVERIRDLDRGRQIRVVNRYINRRHYRHDRSAKVRSALSEDTVRLRSRWSTLTEFMRRGGDCEDYATSKYQLLRALGMAASDLRVVVVYDRDSREHHAVLAVRQPEDEGAWLLDSDDQIYRGHPFGYRFVYALNETSLWDHELDPETWARQAQTEEPSEEPS